MNGLIALVGAGEYLPVMNDIDRYLLDSVRTEGRAPRVACLPTAAGQEGDASVNRWLEMGVRHFEALGANVTPVRVIDRASAADPRLASVIENADLIYFSGGKPDYLHRTLAGSLVWEAAQKSRARGAVYAGCSAGAMILAQRIPNLRAAALTSTPAFQIIPAKFIIPHFDRMRTVRAAFLFAAQRRLEHEEFILGVDENTALVGKLGGDWQVMGTGQAYLITRTKQQAFSAGESVPLHRIPGDL